jgi:hypothetical protein
VPERLRRLKRLRKSWELRKISTEYRITAIGAQLSESNMEEGYLVDCLDGEIGLLNLFPDISIRRLLEISDQKAQLERKMASAKATHYHDSLNLRRCEIFEERQGLEFNQKNEAASLEAIVEVFLSRKP